MFQCIQDVLARNLRSALVQVADKLAAGAQIGQVDDQQHHARALQVAANAVRRAPATRSIVLRWSIIDCRFLFVFFAVIFAVVSHFRAIS